MEPVTIPKREDAWKLQKKRREVAKEKEKMDAPEDQHVFDYIRTLAGM